ncbi:MAG: glutaredoxin domain-containing protein [Gammaproteobacteria bacterium]|nr:glutaredoxin domain-containing protein [Gammaproteobacteria bacterium]
MSAHASNQPLKVYWQPGCSSCLKTKEFLLANGAEFESINVLEDENGFRELEALGLRMVPIVARGSDWANGAVFRDVARVAGFEWRGHDMLAPRELIERIDMILAAAHRYASQIPESELDTLLPGRPRSYRQLAYHVFQIPDVFLDRVEHDAPYTYEALVSRLPAEMRTRRDLLDYGAGVRARLDKWWSSAGGNTDFSQPGKVYYGDVSLHEVLERTAWHSGQHTRQLMLTLEKLGLEPDGRLTDADLAGLPLPENVWDNEKTWD